MERDIRTQPTREELGITFRAFLDAAAYTDKPANPGLNRSRVSTRESTAE